MRHRADRVVERIAGAARRDGGVESVACRPVIGSAGAIIGARMRLLLVIRDEAGQGVRRSAHVVAAGRRGADARHAANVRQELIVFQAGAPLGRPHLFAFWCVAKKDLSAHDHILISICQ